MVDREKVIKGLELCREGRCHSGCPYNNINVGCRKHLDTDAIALLKEQEQRISELKEKLRLLEYGDQDTLQSGMMPAT